MASKGKQQLPSEITSHRAVFSVRVRAGDEYKRPKSTTEHVRQQVKVPLFDPDQEFVEMGKLKGTTKPFDVFLTITEYAICLFCFISILLSYKIAL
jgi:hypothetical protein